MMRRTSGMLSVSHHRHSALLRWPSWIRGHRNVKLLISPCCLETRRYYGYRTTEGYPAPPPPPRYYHNNYNNYNNFSTERDYNAQVSAASSSTGMYINDRENGYSNSNNNNYNPYTNYNETQVRPQYLAGANALPINATLGTNERPIVVIPAQQPVSWGSWLMWCMFIFFGGSYILSIIAEIMMRYNDSEEIEYRPTTIREAAPNIFNSNTVKPVNLDNLEVTFDSIRGCDEAKRELEEIVEFLKDPERFKNLGGRLPKGALLVGPPGCGKTLLAKAIAKEANVSFFYATGSEFDELFVGVGSRRVRELFAAAKANAPSLIFIDEVDALGGRRMTADHSSSRMTLNQLLAEMDGFQSNDAVVVLAATNTPETLDKALTRPGRFDTTVAIDPPDMNGRAEVLQIYLDKIKANASVNAMEIARGTTGFTGAELSNLVNLAAIRAAVLNKEEVTNDEIEYAKDRVMMGAESTKIIPDEDRKVTAYHEGAHALIATLLKDKGAEPVHKATIVPRGSGIMGLVQQQPARDKYSQSKRQCLARLKVCLAGRVGEEVLLGSDDITTGAASDFQQATAMARSMVRRFGFNDSIGVVNYESPDTPEGAYMSDETKRRIEKEVENLLSSAYAETKEMLSQHRSELDLLANNLLKYETLTGEDINKVLKGENLPPRPPKIVPKVKSKDNGKGKGGSEKVQRGNRTDSGSKKGRVIPIS